jgi:DNA repair photolyase
VLEVITRERKPPILTPSSLPCLRDVATINVTAGCALGCKYCYIQGYSHYPGGDRVILYANTPEVVAQELRRKRKPPQRVYFSPSSDAFQYLPQVQDVSLRTMAVLLGAGIEIAFLTKGFITRPFLDLFAGHVERVFAQIGITTLDRTVWRRFEPRTAPPHMRIAAINALVRLGVHTTVRLDPLIPGLTDSDDNLLSLLRALSQSGIREAAASYLFLRPQFARRIQPLLSASPPAHAPHPPSPSATASGAASVPPPADAAQPPWLYQQFSDDSGGGTMLPPAERATRLARLEALGHTLGIRIRPCRCKDPEFATAPCGITGPPPSPRAGQPTQTTFGFDPAEAT